ncbi:hypothetical protein C8Q76DRAFT_727676 [Earliella scabrosa]|nr:hypothetical protein C8Q76DRAFT_727676 [Earliella scabrosa]
MRCGTVQLSRPALPSSVLRGAGLLAWSVAHRARPCPMGLSRPAPPWSAFHGAGLLDCPGPPQLPYVSAVPLSFPIHAAVAHVTSCRARGGTAAESSCTVRLRGGFCGAC